MSLTAAGDAILYICRRIVDESESWTTSELLTLVWLRRFTRLVSAPQQGKACSSTLFYHV